MTARQGVTAVPAPRRSCQALTTGTFRGESPYRFEQIREPCRDCHSQFRTLQRDLLEGSFPCEKSHLSKVWALNYGTACPLARPLDCGIYRDGYVQSIDKYQGYNFIIDCTKEQSDVPVVPLQRTFPGSTYGMWAALQSQGGHAVSAILGWVSPHVYGQRAHFRRVSGLMKT